MSEFPDWITLPPEEWAIAFIVHESFYSLALRYELARELSPCLLDSLELPRPLPAFPTLSDQDLHKVIQWEEEFEESPSIPFWTSSLKISWIGPPYHCIPDCHSFLFRPPEPGPATFQVTVDVDLSDSNQNLEFYFQREIESLRKQFSCYHEPRKLGPEKKRVLDCLKALGRIRLLSIIEAQSAKVEAQAALAKEVTFRGNELGRSWNTWRNSRTLIERHFRECFGRKSDQD